MNEPIDNLLPYQPSPDALAEVRVETNNYSAEFGNVAGAVIGSTIKSGTNEFHGNVFEYWRDSSMAANSWDNNRASAEEGRAVAAHLRRHDRRADRQEQAVLLRRLPERSSGTGPASWCGRVAPEAWRRGDFSGVGVTISDPLTGQPFPGNQIPTSRFSPDRARGARQPDALSASEPARRPNNLVAPNSDKQRAHQGDVKVDANLSSNDRHVRARSRTRSYKSEPERAPLESQLIATNDSPFLGLAFNWTRTLGATHGQRAARRLHARQVPDDSRRTGPASATPTRRSASRAGSRFPA